MECNECYVFRQGLLVNTSCTPTEKAFIIGVHFKPGGAFPFLGLPADDLADTHVDLEHFGDGRPVGSGSAFVRHELLPNGSGKLY
jgi:hypothetical protein